MYLDQQQDQASGLAGNSTPVGHPQRKPVRQWCLASSVEQTDLDVLMTA